MTFKSFTTRLLTLLVLMIGLSYAIHTEKSGIENLFVFVIGFMSMSSLVQWFSEDTDSVFPVPAGWWGRAAVVVLILLRLQLLITIVESGHFVIGTLFAFVTLLNWSAYIDVLKEEREIKEFAVRMSNAETAAREARLAQIAAVNEANTLVVNTEEAARKSADSALSPRYTSQEIRGYGPAALGQP